MQWRTVLRQIFFLAAPVCLIRVTIAATAAFDTAIAGRLSEIDLTGASLGIIVMSNLAMAAGTIASANVAMISEARGEGRYADAWMFLVQGIYVSVLLSLCLGGGVAALAFLPGSFELLGQKFQEANVARTYLIGILPGFPFILVFASLRYALAAMGLSTTTLTWTIVGFGVNALTDVWFAFGGYGIPRLGAAGIGWASTVTYSVMCLGMLVQLVCSAQWRFQATSRWNVNTAAIRRIFAEGWSIGVVTLAEVLLFIVAGLFSGTLGVLAAHQIAMDCLYFGFMIPSAIGEAAKILVGMNRGQRSNVAQIIRVGLWLCVGYAVAVNVLVQTSPRALVSLFVRSEGDFTTVANMAVLFLRIGGGYALFDSVQIFSTGILRGFRDNNVASLITVLCYLIGGVGSSYLLGLVWGFGGFGVWLGLVVGLATASAGLIWRVTYMLRRMM
ncbi:MAG: MATE family efflux transporter [Pleurocapsa sp. SU_196_0]|nr:MATE family efflux transporter [Pleurocapsa sp. SU_196_0]